MTSPLKDSRAAADRVQANLLAYFQLFRGLNNLAAGDEDVLWFANAGGAPGNHVVQTNIDDADVEARIDRALEQIARCGDQIDWLVFPGCRPADLGGRLAARGMPGGPGGTWMLADLTAIQRGAVPAAILRLERVADAGDLELWARLSSAGFGSDVQIYYDAYLRHGFGAEAQSQHYIGYDQGEAVTSATLLLAGGIAGIYDLSTPPQLRRRGYGAAITAAVMREAARQGHADAWLWASVMGRSVYEQVGFTTVDLGVREYRWRRSDR